MYLVSTTYLGIVKIPESFNKLVKRWSMITLKSKRLFEMLSKFSAMLSETLAFKDATLVTLPLFTVFEGSCFMMKVEWFRRVDSPGISFLRSLRWSFISNFGKEMQEAKFASCRRWFLWVTSCDLPLNSFGCLYLCVQLNCCLEL